MALARDLLGALCPPPGPGGPVWIEACLPAGWEGPADRYMARQAAAIAARRKRDPRAVVTDISPLPDRALATAQREAVMQEFRRYAEARASLEGVHVWGVSANHYGLVVGVVPTLPGPPPSGRGAPVSLVRC